MKKYEFRLENVRRVRRLQEEAAKAVLAAANREVQLAHDAIDNALLHYSDVATGNAGAGATATFMAHRYMVKLASDCVVAARADKVRAIEVAEQARLAWSECALALKALDRLDERAREEYRIEFDRDVDKQMDEINVGRHGRPVNA